MFFEITRDGKFCTCSSIGKALILLLLTKYIMRYTIKREYKNAYNNWKCESCGEIFRTRRLLKQHRKDCHGSDASQGQLSTKDVYCCKFCGREWTTTKSGLGFHESYCRENPNKKILKGYSHTEDTKKHLSECAKRNNFGGWHTSKSIDYNGIKLDSSYEVAFAQDLDKNNIKWERPKPLYWKLNSSEHRYYPDFYLSDFNVYVDLIRKMIF